MAKITKKREGGQWRIYVDGVRSALFIEKGEAPRYRHPQEHYVCHDTDDFLFSVNSVGRAETVLQLLLSAAEAPADG